MMQVEYGNQTIAFDLIYREGKTLDIEVHPDKSVLVKAPLNTDLQEIYKRIVKRGRWVLKQQDFFDQFLPRTPEREYVPGESHYYLGRKYVLHLRKGKERSVKLISGQIRVVSPSLAPEAIMALLSSWYYNHAQVKFDEVYNETLQIFKRFDVGNPNLEIRRMKNRWGSCTPSQKIILNPEIIKAPKRCIQYVMIHEFCHLVIPNHNKEFYQLLGEMMPEWERWKSRLEGVMV